jgi:hypothetical protein
LSTVSLSFFSFFGQDGGLDFGLLPILLCFASIGLVFLTCCLLWLAILLAGSLAHKAVLAYFARNQIAFPSPSQF